MDNLKLKPKDLKRDVRNIKVDYDPKFYVENTDELIYGQERAINSFNFGLEMEHKGYNIFFEGPTGVGKSMFVNKFVREKAKEKETPPDYVYVYNFAKPNEPSLIKLESGTAREFKLDMDKYIEYVIESIKKIFAEEEIEKEKKNIQADFEKIKEEEIKKLNEEVNPLGFEIQKSNDGIFMIPKVSGKVLNKEEYMALSDAKKQELQKNAPDIQNKIYALLTKLREYDIKLDKKIAIWQEKVGNITIKQITSKLMKKYSDNEKILRYLEDVQKDIAKNIDEILKPEEPNQNAMLRPKPKPWDNYHVNVFIDNYGVSGAPVIMDLDYSYENIFGKVEYENNFGSVTTDYTKIRSGIVHQANGGYIVFEAKELLTTPRAYENLKKILKREEIGIESPFDQRNLSLLTSLKPEVMPINVKVIILGHRNVYYFLMQRDPDFIKLFKVKSEFEERADYNKENVDKIAKFVSSYVKQENLLPINESGVKKIVEYAISLSKTKDKLSTDLAELGRMLSESSIFAKLKNRKEITDEDIKKATDERRERVSKYEKDYNYNLEKEIYLIDTQGSKVGEINALSVISIGTYKVGKPTKITVNTYKGAKGIVNIERESNLSGNTHNKGVLIIGGYLGQKFAQDFPISYNATICFEQSYFGVDGDSASSTEIYAILSSLSEIPIKQNIAVTGSVNQKGEIQPIGGVNEKITGFFEVCKLKGLKGDEGVIIPKQNVINLHLNDEIIDMVRKGKFHIWAISTIDEGIEILTGIPAGKKNKNGKYSKGSINYLVYEKLKKYSKSNKNKKEEQEEKGKENKEKKDKEKK